MAFYGDVTPGDEFRPSAALSNDIRHFLNGLNGFGGNPFGANGAGTVRIQAYNATGGEIKAGTAVNFDESKRMSGDAVPMKTFSDPRKPWGVVTQRLAEKEGFEYAWALSRTLDDNGTPQADVEAIYVDEVCRYASFSTLGL